MELFDRTAQPDWPWFEEVLAYDNAKLAHALILSGRCHRATSRARARPADVALAGGSANLGERPLPAHRQQRILSARRRARDFRPATHRGARHGVRLSRSLPRHRRTRGGTNRPSAPSTGSSAGTIWAWNCTRPTPAAAATRCTWTASTRTRARNPPSPSCSRWRKCSSCKTPSPSSTSRLVALQSLMKTINVQRTQCRPASRPQRGCCSGRFCSPNDQRARRICAQVMALPESEVHTLLAQVQAEFGERHVKTREFLRRRFEQVQPCVAGRTGSCPKNGSCCSARISATSIRSKPRRCSIPPSCRTRTSRTFRPARCVSFSACAPRAKGIFPRSPSARDSWMPTGNITINAPTRYCLEPDQVPNASYEKGLFERKLQELGLAGDFSRQVLQVWATRSRLDELRASRRPRRRSNFGRPRPGNRSGRQKNPDAGPIELRSAVRAGLASVRTRAVPRHAVAEQRHRGRPLCPLPQR